MILARLRRIMFCCGLAASLLVPLELHAEPVPEHELKAAFVYNFVLFAEWPDDTTYEGNALNICISQYSPLRVPLSSLADKPVRGRRVALRYLAALDDLRACHVLFVDSVDRERWARIRKGLSGMSILTISDDEEINRNGCIIGMEMDRSRIVFDIDMKAARQARLVLSSKLLRLARTVQ